MRLASGRSNKLYSRGRRVGQHRDESELPPQTMQEPTALHPVLLCAVLYLWHDGQNIAPAVLLEDEANDHPRGMTGLTRLDETGLGPTDERRPDMMITATR